MKLTPRTILIALALPAALLSLAAPARAQYTAVSATVADANGTLYNNCVVNISYVPAPGATTVPTIGGSTFQTVIPVVNCDSNAQFSVSLVDNNQVSDGHTVPPSSMWNFSVCSAKNAYPIQYCFSTSIVITGATQNVSAALTAAPAPLLPGPGCGNLWNATVAYPIGCVTSYGGLPYTSLIANNLNHLPPSSPTAWQPGGGSGGGACGAVWSSSTIYPMGCTATYSGILYVSLINSNLNNIPSASPSDWGIPPTGTAQTYGGLVDIDNYGAFATDIYLGYHPTATCIAASPNVSLSGAGGGANLWTANGQGIALPNCGPAPTIATPSAPTVVNMQATAPVGTGHYVATTNGSTSRTIVIVGVDAADGVTAASAGTTVTNGPAALGEFTVNITSATRSGVTNTYTTSAHALVNGAYVAVVNTSVGDFDGWWNTATVPDTTHFTITGGINTDGPYAETSATGGTFVYRAGLHISWAHDANAPKHCAWETAGPEYTAHSSVPVFLGCSRPNGASDTEDWLEYWGSTESGNLVVPDYLVKADDTTGPPSSPINQTLASTIVSGAGTTSLVIANNASNSSSTYFAFLDNSIALHNACVAALAANGVLYIPPGTTSQYAYVISAPTTCPVTSIRQGGSLDLEDTLTLPYTFNWQATIEGASAADPEFSLPNGCGNPNYVGAAYPGIYLPGNTPTRTDGLCLEGQGNLNNPTQTENNNGALLILADEISAMRWENFALSTTGDGGITNDITGIGMVRRYQGSGGYDNQINTFSYVCGPNDTVFNSRWAPILMDLGDSPGGSPGLFSIHNIAGPTCGLYVENGASNNRIDVGTFHDQGPVMPMLTVGANSGGNLSGWINLSWIQPDTTYIPTVAFAGVSGITFQNPIIVTDSYGPQQNTQSVYPPFLTGGTVAAFNTHGVAFLLSPNNIGQNTNVFFDNGTQSLSQLVPSLFALLPTCNSVSTGTSQYITDSNVTGVGSTITGGGTSPLTAFCNGTNWVVGQGGIGTTFNPASPGVIGGTTPNIVNSTQVNLPEQSGTPPGISATTTLGAVSGNHWPAFNPNNAGARYLCGLTGSVTSGHIAAFNQTGTICDIVDGGTGTGSGTVTSFSANAIATGTQNFATAGVTSPGVTPALTFTLATAPAHKFFMNNSGSAAAPDYETAGEADLPATTVFTDQNATFGAYNYLFTAATQFRVRASAGLTTATDGDFGLDTTNHNFHGLNNGSDLLFPMVPIGTAVNGDCVKWVVTSGNVRQGDAGGACGSGSGPTLQVGTVNNSSQTLLNFDQAYTTAVTGGAVAFKNVSGGIVEAQVQTTGGGGNAVPLMTQTSARTGDYLAYASPASIVNTTPGVSLNAQTGTTYTVLTGDRGKLLTFSNSSAIAVTLPQANSTGFDTNFFVCTKNIGSAPVTITPTTSTINAWGYADATLVLYQGMGACIYSDNTNYTADITGPQKVAAYNSTNQTGNLATTNIVPYAHGIPNDGPYQVTVYIGQHTACTTVGSSSLLTATEAFTDDSGTRNAVNTFTPTTSNVGVGVYSWNITTPWLAAGTQVTLALTFADCSSGGGSGNWFYDVHTWVEKQ